MIAKIDSLSDTRDKTDGTETRASHLRVACIKPNLIKISKGPKLSEEKGKKLNKFFRRSFLRIANVDRKIAEIAQKQVWDNGIKPKDAIHVATALSRNCSILETFDKGPLRKNSKFDNLEIRTPQKAKQPRLDLGDGQ